MFNSNRISYCLAFVVAYICLLLTTVFGQNHATPPLYPMATFPKLNGFIHGLEDQLSQPKFKLIGQILFEIF